MGATTRPGRITLPLRERFGFSPRLDYYSTDDLGAIVRRSSSILGVSIDDSLLVPAEKSMLEDLIAAAINEARGKADAAAGEQMQSMTSGLQLPPGFKLPF